jgi:hypothetical protein
MKRLDGDLNCLDETKASLKICFEVVSRRHLYNSDLRHLSGGGPSGDGRERSAEIKRRGRSETELLLLRKPRY